MVQKQIQIGDKVIGGDDLFIVAEVGNQFHGDLETSKRLVDTCVNAGADMIKFIFWFPDEIFTEQGLKDVTVTYDAWESAGPWTLKEYKTEPIGDVIGRLQMDINDWWELRGYCLEKNMLMMSTINCSSGIDLDRYINLDALKIDSWGWNFPDLWRWCLQQHKPVFADCGPVSFKEIAKNVNLTKEEFNEELVLMHCVHTPRHEAFNMRTIPYLKEKFGCPVGYASANNNDDTDIMAVALGADVLEKRITLDRCGGEIHDAISKEPTEFEEYVKQMRKLKASVGKFAVVPSREDLTARKKWFRRIVADMDIFKGETIRRDMLEAKRGETGVSPEFMWDFVGKKATRDIKKNESIGEDDVVF